MTRRPNAAARPHGARNLRALLRDLEGRGWRISRTRGSHYQARAPRGGIVVISGTAGDRRAIRNAAAQCRRAERAASARLEAAR